MIARTRRSAGLTVVEMLVAVAIALVFIGAVVMAFVQILRATDQSQTRLEAMANARHAIDDMARELVRAQVGTGGKPAVFIGEMENLTHGDYVDNDRDGRVDEEDLNGIDDDNDWTNADDNHAVLSLGTYERVRFMGKPDFGDFKVDEDTKFTSAGLTFRSSDTSTGEVRRVRYYLVDSGEGEMRTLMRELIPDNPDESPTTAPVAYNVLSFGAMFWDQEGVFKKDAKISTPPYDQYWRTTWNADEVTSGVQVPVSVCLAVTVFAGTPEQYAVLKPGQPIDTVTLYTVSNPEAALQLSRASRR